MNDASSWRSIKVEMAVADAWQDALSALTSSLAHDTNNYLTSVVALSDNCLLMLPPENPMVESLKLIRDSGQKAGLTLRRLQQLHNNQPGKTHLMDLEAMLKESMELLRPLLPRRLPCVLQLPGGSMPIRVDPGELQRAVFCLGLNSAEVAQPGHVGVTVVRHSTGLSRDVLAGVPPVGPCFCISFAPSPPLGPAGRFNPEDPQMETMGLPGKRLLVATCFAARNQGAIACSSNAEGLILELWLPEAPIAD